MPRHAAPDAEESAASRHSALTEPTGARHAAREPAPPSPPEAVEATAAAPPPASIAAGGLADGFSEPVRLESPEEWRLTYSPPRLTPPNLINMDKSGDPVGESAESPEPAESPESNGGLPPWLTGSRSRPQEPSADTVADQRAPTRRPLIVVAGAVAVVVLALSTIFGGAALRDRDAAPAAWQSGAPSPTTASAAPVVPTAAPDSVTLTGVGDVIMGTLPGDLPPRGGQGLFSHVTEALTGDLVMGNLETALTDDTGRIKCRPTEPVTPSPTATATTDPSPRPNASARPAGYAVRQALAPSGCFQLYLPPSYADRLREGGFDLVNLANNHTGDMGATGLRNTRAALTAAGVKHTGVGATFTVVQVNGARVAVVGFSTYQSGPNLNDIPASVALVRKAAANADIVVVQMQGGAEGSSRTHVRPGRETYLGENRGDLVAFSHAVIDAGADVVFGHGPHIMRGMEFYRGRLIAYSLGNFCGYGVLSTAGDLGVGGVLRVTLRTDGSWVNGTLASTRMTKSGVPALDPTHRARVLVDRLSQEDFDTRAARIDSANGTISPPRAS